MADNDRSRNQALPTSSPTAPHIRGPARVSRRASGLENRLRSVHRSVARARSSASQALLADVVVEIAASPRPRDAESGRLLLDYYVKRVGSHEVVMGRLCLSRPTFYRPLHRGLCLVTERLEELGAPAVRNLGEVSTPDSDFETAMRLPVRPILAKPVHVVGSRVLRFGHESPAGS
jgi:hypothetical protein